jgi:hypothetical protein
MWHQARELADKYMIQERFDSSMWWAWDRDKEDARKSITKGLLLMVTDDVDLSNDNLPDILRSSFSAADVEGIVQRLRMVRYGTQSHRHVLAHGQVIRGRLFLRHLGSALLRPQTSNELHHRQHWWTLLWHLLRLTR